MRGIKFIKADIAENEKLANLLHKYLAHNVWVMPEQQVTTIKATITQLDREYAGLVHELALARAEKYKAEAEAAYEVANGIV
jgi:hypothetical protein